VPDFQGIQERAIAYRALAINKDNSHYRMASRYDRRHKLLGVPVIVTTAIVSTAIFTTLETEASGGWRIATGLLSVVAVVLSALQTFFNYAELSQRHQGSARGYSRVRRSIEIFLLRYDPAAAEAALADLTQISEQLGQLEAEEPAISARVYARVRREHSNQ
jgi:hypothetical protein